MKKIVSVIKPIFYCLIRNELFKFYLSGGMIAIFGFLLFYGLYDIVGIWFLMASIWTDIFCYTSGFFMKKFFVFKKKKDSKIVKVSPTNVIILFIKPIFIFVIQVLLFFLVTSLYVGIDAFFMLKLVSTMHMNPYMAKIIVAIPMSLLSFCLNKKITFSNPIYLLNYFLEKKKITFSELMSLLRNHFLTQKIRSYK